MSSIVKSLLDLVALKMFTSMFCISANILTLFIKIEEKKYLKYINPGGPTEVHILYPKKSQLQKMLSYNLIHFSFYCTRYIFKLLNVQNIFCSYMKPGIDLRIFDQ